MQINYIAVPALLGYNLYIDILQNMLCDFFFKEFQINYNDSHYGEINKSID